MSSVYLSLTLETPTQRLTLPLTPWLLCLWLMTASPTFAHLVKLADQWTETALTLTSSFLFSLVMLHIILKAFAYGVSRS